MSTRRSAGVAVSLSIRFVSVIIFRVIASIDAKIRSAVSTEQEKGGREACGEERTTKNSVKLAQIGETTGKLVWE